MCNGRGSSNSCWARTVVNQVISIANCMFHVNTYASVTKVSIIKEDLIDWLIEHWCVLIAACPASVESVCTRKEDRPLPLSTLRYRRFISWNQLIALFAYFRYPSIHPSIYCSMGSAPVSAQCPLTYSLGEFLGYWDWVWYPGLSPVLVSIALPFAFHISVFSIHSSSPATGFHSSIFNGGGICTPPPTLLLIPDLGLALW